MIGKNVVKNFLANLFMLNFIKEIISKKRYGAQTTSLIEIGSSQKQFQFEFFSRYHFYSSSQMYYDLVVHDYDTNKTILISKRFNTPVKLISMSIYQINEYKMKRKMIMEFLL